MPERLGTKLNQRPTRPKINCEDMNFAVSFQRMPAGGVYANNARKLQITEPRSGYVPLALIGVRHFDMVSTTNSRLDQSTFLLHKLSTSQSKDAITVLSNTRFWDFNAHYDGGKKACNSLVTTQWRQSWHLQKTQTITTIWIFKHERRGEYQQKWWRRAGPRSLITTPPNSIKLKVDRSISRIGSMRACRINIQPP